MHSFLFCLSFFYGKFITAMIVIGVNAGKQYLLEIHHLKSATKDDFGIPIFGGFK
ncbi:hypothetical protein IMCC9480_3653 [Oxalobacteraceae bacterium IMCC9480]|nr:hypothetical protein IMCC9480_3653 [Oxalobacteraceae bacterium IMCC9480]